MQEIAIGVYVGNFNVKIREELWKRVIDSVGVGEATLSFSYRNEIGYDFKTHNTSKVVLDCEGIPLVLQKNKEKDFNKSDLGFSKASKAHKLKKFASVNKKGNFRPKALVFLDIETNGLNENIDDIIEIGAIKVDRDVYEFQELIKISKKLPKEIIELTGITDDDLKIGKDLKSVMIDFMKFLGDSIVVGYNVNFDIKFINKKLEHLGLNKISNKVYDLMDFVKKDNQFLNDYKLQTALLGYGIEKIVPHRALEDAKLTHELSDKVNKFVKFIEKQ